MTYLKLIKPYIYRLILSSTVVLFLNSPLQAGPGHFNEYQVKSAFLYNLTNFISWPQDSFTAPDSPFIITILGPDQFGENLRTLVQNEQVNTHPIEIKQTSTIAKIGTTHILFIHKEYKDKIASVLKQSKQSGLLTVSDYPGFCKKGGAVNLLLENNRLNLELNVESATQNEIKFSSKLLQLAKLVVKNPQ